MVPIMARSQPRSQAATVVLAALATHRLTRLLVTDRILEAPRTRLQEVAEARWAARRGITLDMEEPHWHSPAAFWLSCPWCAGLWVAAAVVAALAAGPHPPAHPVLLALAASSITGLLSGLEPEES